MSRLGWGAHAPRVSCSPFADLCYILERAGFESRPGSGSHRIYYKQGVVEIVNIQPRSGKGKPYQVKQVRELLLKYKIALE